MGRDKASLPFGPETLLQRVVRIVSANVEDVVVVGRPGQELSPLPASVRIVRDEVPDQGPLGGLAPGLRASRAEAVFVTGCDAPFVDVRVIAMLFARLGDAGAVVPECGGFAQPLCAVYRARIVPIVDGLVASVSLSAHRLSGEVASVRVAEADLRSIDPELRFLVNCNTPESYAAALAQAGF